MAEEKNVKRGRKSKAQGTVFEKRVRKDLEEKGWVVDKWTNQVEWDEANINRPPEERIGKLVPAKPKFVFNPAAGRRIMIGNGSGFPDFIAMRSTIETDSGTFSARSEEFTHQVIGVESKMKGKLDKVEKEKCDWLLENKIFSKILVAEKTKIKNKIHIIYHEYGTSGTS